MAKNTKKPNNYVKFFDSVSFQPLSEDLGKVKDFYTSNLSANKPLRIRIAATHAGKVTRNNGFYLPDKMRKGATSFLAQYAKPIQLHHGDEIDPIGRVKEASYIDLSGSIRNSVLDTAHQQDLKDFDSFVSGKLSWKDAISFVCERLLISDKTTPAIADDPNFEGLGYVELVAEITDPDAIQKILDGRYLTGSVGAITNAAVCSVCKQDWAEDGRCDHTPGQLYDNTKCVIIAGDLSYDEYSFVNRPADRHSKVIEVNVNGIQDFVHLENSVPEKQQPDRVPEITFVVVDQVELYTGMSDGHYHSYSIDPVGNGFTSIHEDHRHEIRDGKTLVMDNHTHSLMNTGSMEDKQKMTFKNAFAAVSKLERFKDKKGLEDAVKKLLDENKKIEGFDEKKLLELLDAALGTTPPAEPSIVIPVLDKVLEFFGADTYKEIVGDDPWGAEYAEMMFGLLEDVTDENREKITKEVKDAKLSSSQRKALGSSTFCGPGRSFPVPDCAHYTAALRLIGRYKGPGDKDSIRACVMRKGKRMGCTSDAVQDSDKKTVEVTSSEFSLDFFDNYSDSQLIQLVDGLQSALKERNIECTSCKQEAAKILELEAQIKILQAVVPVTITSDQSTELKVTVNTLTSRLEAAHKEIKYLHEDIDNLQDSVSDAHTTTRDLRVSRLLDLKSLSGEEFTRDSVVKELQSKSSFELDEMLKDHATKVDIQQITDRLKSGMARNPEGKVTDPTLLDKTKINQPSMEDSIESAKMKSIKNRYMQLRGQLNGQSKADAYLEQLRATGVIASVNSIK